MSTHTLDIKVNDRVKFVPKSGIGRRSLTPFSNTQYRDIMAHPYGTVRGFFEKYVTVEFDQIRMGHPCDGVVPSCNGLYIHPQELNHMSNTKVISISKLI